MTTEYDAIVVDDTMPACQRARDEHALPIYEFTTQMATLDPPPREMRQHFAAIAEDQDAMDGFVSVMTGTVPPTDFFAPENVVQILTGAERGAVA